MANAFVEALLGSSLPVIMEVKRRDGNGNDLMGERTPKEIAAEYMAAGAPCLSVVTGRWFGGDDGMLREVMEIADRPVLKKDFITRESQVKAAKEMGASAILLTARILPKASFPGLIETTLKHGLLPFVEIADHEEIERVVHPEECIVAINNKDIIDQERGAADIDVSRSLLDAIIATGTPCPVSASGISDPREAAELVTSGFKGLLIGAGLLQSGGVAEWVETFQRHRSAVTS